MMKHPIRLAALIAAAGLLAAAGVMTFRQPSPPTAAAAAQSQQIAAEASDPLTAFRTEREQLRQKQRAELNDIIHSAATDAATLALAQRQLLQLMESETAEATLEGLLSARGFDGALASVNGGAVYIMTRKNPLTRRDSAIILDLALRETGVTAGNVKIVALPTD